jgi:beta-lactamase regulating signal transducer with metallopeptidase domain
MTDTLAAIVPLLGRALLHFVWQGALIAALAALALRALRDATPQARYAVACLALAACALAPVLTLLTLSIDGDRMSAPGKDIAVLAVTGGRSVLPFAVADGWIDGLNAALPQLVALWAAGACALSLRICAGLAWIRRLRATPQGPAQALWQARLDALSAQAGVRRRVVLRLVDALASPAVAGCWRPAVLLPLSVVARMPVELVDALLAHELAHVRRHDYLVNLLQSAVEALLFYHPAVWWLSRRIRIEREQVADALAADALGAPRRLALALSELAESSRDLPVALLPAAHGGHLMARIRQLVQPQRRTRGGRFAFAALGIVAAGIAVLAHAHVGDAAPAAIGAPHAASSFVAAPPPVRTQVAAVADTSTAGGAKKAHRGDAIRVARSDARDGYALVRGGGAGTVTMSGDSADSGEIERLRGTLGRDFLWFRRDGKGYVIVDPGTIAEATAAWRDMDAGSRDMQALSDQMQPHSAKMQALSAQMQRLSTTTGQSGAMRDATQRMQALAAKQKTLAEGQAALAGQQAGVDADAAGQQRLQAQSDALAQQMDALSAQMDQQSQIIDAEAAKIERSAEPMQALGQQMEEAGKPMQALGARMETLGKEQERLARLAEARTRKLIDEAVRKGLASPAPATTNAQ